MINEARIKKLEKILANYPDILSEFGIREQVLKSFKFEKTLTSIEIEAGDKEKVTEFIEGLKDFFFVDQTSFESDSQDLGFSGLIIISRFKKVFDAAMSYVSKHNGLLDKFADLSGILFGYSCKAVVEYCSNERLRKYNLIKQ